MSSQQSSGEQPGSNDDAPEASNGLTGAAAFRAALAEEVGNDDEPGESGTGDDEGKPGESRKKVKPENLEALAQALGVEVSELYSVKVPAGSGREAMTLGQLKDRFAEWDSLEADRLAFSETRVQQEAELQRGLAEFRELLTIIPKEQLLNREVLTRAAARAAEKVKAQEAQLLVAIPEWKVEATRTKERGELASYLEGYGYSKQEAESIRDPRLVKLLRDAHRREQQVRAALAKVKPAQRKPAGSNTATGAPSRGEHQQHNTGKPSTPRGRFFAELHKTQ